MFNKNVFTQKDPIADLVKPMLEAQAKAKMEELKGNQKVLDKNKNNKLDSQDFAILRGEKKTVKEEEQVDESSPFDWKKPREPEVKGGAGVKKGRAYGGAAQKSKPEQETDDDKKMKKEEVEQIDEISSGLATNYLNKREVQHKPNMNSPETSNRDAKVAKGIRGAVSRAHGYGPDKNAANKVTGRFEYRKNVGATHTFNKEEVERIEERSLTSGEKAEMEKNVKGMKKNLAGFKARYGDRAKSVMYATATKKAKKD